MPQDRAGDRRPDRTTLPKRNTQDDARMTRWEARGRVIVSKTDRVPKVMGIVNATPDSFSDGGRSSSVHAAVRHALTLVEEGADLLDIGAESTRPGSSPVPLEEELKRLLPVLEGIAAATSTALSIDTSKARVASEALDRGAVIINDITALRGDPDMARVVAERGAGIVLMHMQGEPSTMQDAPHYDDVEAEVLAFLEERIRWCESVGIRRAQIAVDPGIGFGKTFTHNLKLLKNLERFATLGCVLLVGTSRKGFLGRLTGRDVSGRTVASAVSSLACGTAGARVLRVHDVAAMVDSIRVWTALRGWGEA
jgi:dihydropteroate synthase